MKSPETRRPFSGENHSTSDFKQSLIDISNKKERVRNPGPALNKSSG